MKVVLLKDVRAVGTKDSVKEVSDGYALNFLIPQRLAVQATKEKLAAVEKRQQEQKSQIDADVGQLAVALKKINGSKINIRAKANDKGHLFKALAPSDIAAALAKEAGVTIDADMIDTKGSVIKSVGEHAVHIKTAAGEAALTIAVSAES